MKNRIYYYTGTGNSLWIARQLADRLKISGDKTELVSLGTDYALPDTSCDRVGIIFPVHIWGLPRRVIEFVSKLPDRSSTYYFALAVNAGQVAATLVQLRRLLATKGIVLGTGFDMVMPSNYIPWGGAQPDALQAELFAQAQKKLDRIAKAVEQREHGAVEKGTWWRNIFLSAANKMSFSQVPKMDKDFWADEKCNGCGMCSQVCPAANIQMENGKPVWRHHCEQCLACLQWCPQEAIQYANKTAGKKHYHHPDVSSADMVGAARK